MSTPYYVHVSNIAPTTTKAQLADFFTFCGEIETIEYQEKETKATVYFTKSNAVTTALMLHGGNLDNSALQVTSDVAHEDEPAREEARSEAKQEPTIEQHDKPRAGIAAEYLARGYELSDNILQRAIEIDNKQGISSRFLSYFHSLDSSLGARALGPEQTISGKVTSSIEAATQQAKSVDEQKGYSKIATDYYTKALGTSFGQTIKSFYTSTSKQIQDIHEEAKRIRAAHKEAPAAKPESSTAAPAA